MRFLHPINHLCIISLEEAKLEYSAPIESDGRPLLWPLIATFGAPATDCSVDGPHGVASFVE